MKILDFIKVKHDGFDIGDNTYDWGNYFSCPESYELCRDSYDKVLLWIGSNTDLLHYRDDWYSVVDLTKFIRDYINIFDEFFNQAYKKGYRPKDLIDNTSIDSDAFYDVYLMGVEEIINGNFATTDYDLLWDIIQKGEKHELE